MIKDIYKAVYQDKALNRRSEEFTAVGWADVIILAYQRLKAGEKLISIQWVREEEV